MRILATLCFIFMLGCDNTQSTNRAPNESRQIIKEYDENGNLIGEFEAIDSVFDGKARIYDDSGRLRITEFYKNGLKSGKGEAYYASGAKMTELNFAFDLRNGPFSEFFENGNPKSKGMYLNDELIGVYTQYYANPRERIRRIEERVMVGNESKVNYVAVYDKEGNLVEETSRLKFEEKRDTLYILIESAEAPNSIAIVGDFDKFFNLGKNENLDTLVGSNGLIKIPLSTDTIRGTVDIFHKLDDGDIFRRHMWFSYPREYLVY